MLRKIQDQCKESGQQLNIAVAHAGEIFDENRAGDARSWLLVARQIQDIPPLMPEDVLWHDAVFSIARICYVLFISHALDFLIIPNFRRYVSLTLRNLRLTSFRFAPDSVIAKLAEKLSPDVREENHQAVADALRALHVRDFRNTVRDSIEAKETVAILAKVVALLWRIAPVLWRINDSSDNSAIKKALEDLRLELGRGTDKIDTEFGLSRLGLKW